MTERMLQRRGTAAEWTSANTVLGSGELGVESDTGKVKVGNGTSAWSSLSYVGVSSFDLEAVQDAVAGMLVAGTNVTLSYDDTAGTLTVSAAGGSAGLDLEAVQDAVAGMLVAGTNVTLSYDDPLGKLTVSAAGGSAGASWSPLVSHDPMTSNVGGTRWSPQSGTWTFDANGAIQAANVQDALLRLTGTSLDPNGVELRAIEADVHHAWAGGKVGFGFCSASGAWGNQAVAIGLDAQNSTVWWDRFGVGGSTAPMGFTWAYNTFAKLKVVQVGAKEFHVFVNGVRRAVIDLPGTALLHGGLGLYARSTACTFKDVTAWKSATTYPTS